MKLQGVRKILNTPVEVHTPNEDDVAENSDINSSQRTRKTRRVETESKLEPAKKKKKRKFFVFYLLVSIERDIDIENFPSTLDSLNNIIVFNHDVPDFAGKYIKYIQYTKMILYAIY